MAASENLSPRQFTAKQVQAHLEEHHGVGTSIGSWDAKSRRDYHSNLHKYGGSKYDKSVEGGRHLTHDHKGLPTRKSRGMPNG